MLKPPEFDNNPSEGADIRGICPIMSDRSVFPIQVNSAPLAGLSGNGLSEIKMLSSDKIIYCQGSRCAWYQETFHGCIVHVLMNLRELVDTVKIMDFDPDRLRSRIQKAKEGIDEDDRREGIKR